MKRIAPLLLLILAACNPKQEPTVEAPIETVATTTFPEKIADATIYEVNIRQHTPEGTINAFAEDLPRLKDLGIDVLWIMPIQPIGVKERKGSLGSYYSINDYETVNPEFGTDEDFKNLIKKCHEMDMYVILDWVPNHTAWDHPWITEHPDYYTQNEKGEIVYEADWSDIALLDHTNPATRRAMIDALKVWITEYDVDGFRCDHAGHEIPLYFWEEATAELDEMKDIFWLAEWDGARMHLEFDATYAWELLHETEHVAKGEKKGSDLAHWIQKDIKEYGMKPFRMTMITNHDENSWAGTINERYGDAQKAMATFIFTAYGIPMLYSGQEVGLDKRLRFFEKDTIEWSDANQLQPFYKKLIELKKANKALWAGEFGGMPISLNNDENVYAWKREKGGNTVIGITNFSASKQQAPIKDKSVYGTYTDYFTGQQYELGEGGLELEPWQYLIFVK